MKKNKMINAATCDARAVTEESLAGYENIKALPGMKISLSMPRF